MITLTPFEYDLYTGLIFSLGAAFAICLLFANGFINFTKKSKKSP